MPVYSNTTPPFSLFPGDVGFSFNAEAFPANGTAGSQFAIPEPAGLADQTHAVRWQTIFGTAPTAISISLQGAAADVPGEYSTLDTRRPSRARRARWLMFARDFCGSWLLPPPGARRSRRRCCRRGLCS